MSSLCGDSNRANPTHCVCSKENTPEKAPPVKRAEFHEGRSSLNHFLASLSPDDSELLHPYQKALQLQQGALFLGSKKASSTETRNALSIIIDEQRARRCCAGQGEQRRPLD
jgi:hypothetical protein